MGYWFFEWLDDQCIQTIEDAERVLSYPVVVEDLRQQALVATRENIEPKPTDSIPVLAGRGLDLSEQTDCIAPICPTCQANHLFRDIWHYFDYVIIQDAVLDQIVTHWERWNSSDKKVLESHKKRLLST